jgi:hypothetical protein
VNGLQTSTGPDRLAAEASLMQWRQSPTPHAFCRYVLECSTVPAAQFHAALTLHSSLVREWPLYSLTDVLDIRGFLVNFLFQRTATYVPIHFS